MGFIEIEKLNLFVCVYFFISMLYILSYYSKHIIRTKERMKKKKPTSVLTGFEEAEERKGARL